jgi:hypothetical protein
LRLWRPNEAAEAKTVLGKKVLEYDLEFWVSRIFNFIMSSPRTRSTTTTRPVLWPQQAKISENVVDAIIY